MMVNVAVDGGAFLSFRFMKLHFQGVFVMSKRSVLVGLVLVALCAFLVLPVWAVDGAVSGNATVSFNKNVCLFPAVTVSGFSDSSLNGTFRMSDSSLPFKVADSSLNVPASLFSTDNPTVNVSFSDTDFSYLFDYPISGIPDNFSGDISISCADYSILGHISVGGWCYSSIPGTSYYGIHLGNGFTDGYPFSDAVGAFDPADFLYFEYFLYDKYNNLLGQGHTNAVVVSSSIFGDEYNFSPINVHVDGTPTSIIFRQMFSFPQRDFVLNRTSSSTSKPKNPINFGIFQRNSYQTPTLYSAYPLITLPFNASTAKLFSVDDLTVSYSGNTVSAGGDYTSLLNVIISRLDTIIEKIGTGGSGGSTDLSGLETRLDSIIQKLGEVSPMADFEDSYIQNFGGQLEGVESSLSGQDNSLPSGGDMTGFAGALQSSLGIDSAGFSQADFDSAVSSLGGDKIDEGMPWYFFTQAVADSMVTPPSGFSVYSDVSPSDTWVSDSERWLRLWLTPY